MIKPRFCFLQYTRYRQTYQPSNRQPGRQADRQAGSKAGRHTDRQIDRQTDRQTDQWLYSHVLLYGNCRCGEEKWLHDMERCHDEYCRKNEDKSHIVLILS